MLSWPQRLVTLLTEWLDAQWNVPDRTDNYLMQIACEVARTAVKAEHRDKVKMDWFRMKFKDVRPPTSRRSPASPTTGTTSSSQVSSPPEGPPVVTKQSMVEMHKARWLAVTGPPQEEI